MSYVAAGVGPEWASVEAQSVGTGCSCDLKEPLPRTFKGHERGGASANTKWKKNIASYDIHVLSSSDVTASCSLNYFVSVNTSVPLQATSSHIVDMCECGNFDVIEFFVVISYYELKL